MQKIFLIPAYEPDEKLIQLVQELKKEDVSIVVCDDGSGKEYESIFKEIQKDVTLISYPDNKGKGFALKKGIQHIQAHYSKPYLVVTMDCDGQHSIKDAKKLCSYVEQHPKEIALGKRLRKENTPLRSKIGNAITHFIYRFASGINVYDTQTGLRAFSDQYIPFLLNIKGNRYEYEMNVLLYASKNLIPLTEIEIDTIYIDENKTSHFQTLKDSYLIYKEILKFSLSSFFSFCIDYILFLIIHIFFNPTISNISARIISSISNFFFNKKLVFQSKNNTFKEGGLYFLFAALILIINTLILNELISCEIPYYISKLIVEAALFLVSWLVQKNFIFERRNVL